MQPDNPYCSSLISKNQDFKKVKLRNQDFLPHSYNHRFVVLKILIFTLIFTHRSPLIPATADRTLSSLDRLSQQGNYINPKSASPPTIDTTNGSSVFFLISTWIIPVAIFWQWN